MRLFFKSLPVEIVSVSCIASQTTDPTPQYAASPVAVHTLPVPHGWWAQESLSSSAGVSPAASLLLLRHWSPPTLGLSFSLCTSWVRPTRPRGKMIYLHNILSWSHCSPCSVPLNVVVFFFPPARLLWEKFQRFLGRK